MQFCDIEKPLHELRHAHLEREKAANESILESNGDLAAFDNERIEIAANEWKAFADEYFNLAEVFPIKPIRRDTPCESLTVRFRMPEGQIPREEGMIFAEGMVLLDSESSAVIPGSLQKNDDGTWQADFDGKEILNHACCEGDFDFYLGGINTEGRTFAGQVILHFI